MLTVPPEIQKLSNITANEGDNEVLNCTAAGFPLPNVVWYKDNEEHPRQMVGSYIQSESIVKRSTLEPRYYIHHVKS